MDAYLDRMRDDLLLKGYAPQTQQRYLEYARRLEARYQRHPAELTAEEVRSYLLELTDQGLASRTRVCHVAALRFLYRTTLQLPEVVGQTWFPKVEKHVPVILGQTEVGRLFAAIRAIKYRAILMAAYGSGLRIGEACGLRSDHIDSELMVIHVPHAKRGRARYTVLSHRLLALLRTYWRRARPPGPELFPDTGPDSVRVVLRSAVLCAGIKKRVTPHVLRHSFATHLFEAGVDIRAVQALLGHGSINTTAHYARVTTAHVARITSPLDELQQLPE